MSSSSRTSSPRRAHPAAPLPEVRLDHALVRLDLGRRALGDLLAVLEHGEALGDAHHDLHVVLDQQHGQPLLVAHATDERREVGRLLRVHPGRRLVEQQQLRVGRERPRDLEPPLVAVGQRARLLLVAPRQAAVDEQLARLLARRRLLALDPRACARSSRGCRRAAGSACRRARSRPRSSGRRGGCSGTCGRSRAR